MTTEAYPELLEESVEDIAKVLREIIRIRNEDVGDFDNLENTFINKDQVATAIASDDSIFFSDKDDEDSIKKGAVQDIVDFSKVASGFVFDYAGTSAPSGYLECDGSAVSRTTYADLFSAIGTTWGVGDGSTTFNLPNFQRRTTIGSGGSGTSTIGNAVGNVGGSETHTLTTSEMPSHSHNNHISSNGNEIYGTNGTFPAGASEIVANPTEGGEPIGLTSSKGSINSHNNIQPSAVVMKVIKT